MNIIKRVNPLSKIVKFKNKLKHIYNFISNVEINHAGNTTYIRVPENMILSSGGNLLIHSEDGTLVMKHKRTHINPDIEFEVRDSLDNIVKKATDKKILLGKQLLFIDLLRKNKIYTR